MPVQISDNSFTHNTAVYHGGRGGAGNYRKLTTAERTARDTPNVLPPTTSSSKIFFGGRGGAGNVHPTSERAMFSFDEELERDRLIHEHHAPVYSIGRGGKGNLVSCDDIATRSFYSGSGSPRTSPRASADSRRSSTSSGADGAELAPATSAFSAASIRSGADKLWERVRRLS